MLKLYYAPGACPISPHIALREAAIPFELDRIDWAQGKKTESGKSYVEINPKGYVPALVLDNGQLLTEGAVIVQYIADLKPEARLAPPPGSFERVRLQEGLNFIATELHKGMSPFYSSIANDEYKAAIRERVAGKLAFLEKSLAGRPYLFGDGFTVADGYAFYALRSWQKIAQGKLSDGLAAYYAGLAERPSVRTALQVEGLTP